MVPVTPSLDVSGLTHVGRERRRNEDQFLIARLERRLQVLGTSVDDVAQLLPPPRAGMVFLVADGMGGGAAGDVASSTAVRTVVDYVCNVMPWAANVPEPPPGSSEAPMSSPASSLPGVRVGLTAALREGDVAVRKMASSFGGGSMGTTATLAYLQWPHFYVAHVGDSRAYLLRAGEVMQLTTDHTLAARLKERTDITIDDSSPWHHVLWNALGAGENAAIEPEVHRHELQPGDVLLICSDGLTKHVDDANIAEELAAASSAETACRRLVDLANDAGGTDNITAVVCYCDAEEQLVDSDAPTVAIAAVDEDTEDD